MPSKKEVAKKVKPKVLKIKKSVPKKEVKKELPEVQVQKTPLVESLALMTHFHNKQESKLLKTKLKFLRINQYLETNPTLWQISWSILWRVFLLIQLSMFMYVLINSILVAFFYDSFIKILL